MINFSPLFKLLEEDKQFHSWIETLEKDIDLAINDNAHGDMPKWEEAFSQLPDIINPRIELNQGTIEIGSANDLNEMSPKELKSLLKAFMPWRKGPFSFFGTEIETEWRSDWKWQRIEPHLSPISGRRILDVGCGSGYHLWRMLGQKAKLVIGIDPSRLYMMQFACAKKYAPDAPVFYLPLRMEDLPRDMLAFDTIFSMGVLYHRRSPLDHILELKSALTPGGELILETLVIPGENSEILFPKDRYAMMRNVFFLPTVPLLQQWLERMGFIDIKCVDVNQTTTKEQKVSEWMEFKSLADFLDPDDHNLTIEGYPAPLRATLIAKKP